MAVYQESSAGSTLVVILWDVKKCFDSVIIDELTMMLVCFSRPEHPALLD